MNKIIDSLLEYNEGDWEETAEDIKMLYQIAKLKADDIMFEWKVFWLSSANILQLNVELQS